MIAYPHKNNLEARVYQWRGAYDGVQGYEGSGSLICDLLTRIKQLESALHHIAHNLGDNNDYSKSVAKSALNQQNEALDAFGCKTVTQGNPAAGICPLCDKPIDNFSSDSKICGGSFYPTPQEKGVIREHHMECTRKRAYPKIG